MTVLAQNLGEGLGWRRQRDHRFVLSSSASTLNIYVDGDPIFELTAAAVGLTEFPLGRFGFYNYSLVGATYQDLQELPYLPERVFHDNFEQEADGLGYDAFARWEVVDGSVDVIARGPTNRLIDLDGSSQEGGTMRTRDPITLLPGTYRLMFELTPTERPETVRVRLGDVYAQDIAFEQRSPIQRIERNIVVDTTQEARLSFSSDSADNDGALLDSVALYRVR